MEQNGNVAKEECENGAGGETFPLAWLPTELLGGVTQRLKAPAKMEAELVDGRLAAVTRALAWRKHRSLALHVQLRPDAPLELRAGDGSFELSDRAAAAVAGFFVGRATVVEFKAVSELRNDGGLFEDNYHENFHILEGEALQKSQAQMRAVATALLAPAVHLRTLLLEGTATELFGEGGAPAAALFRRHAATLERAALGFRLCCSDSQEVYAAVRACVALRRFSCRLQWAVDGSCRSLEALLDGWQLGQCALVLFSTAAVTVQSFRTQFPSVHELQRHNVECRMFPSRYSTFPSVKLLHMCHAENSSLGLLFVYDITLWFFTHADVEQSVRVELGAASLLHALGMGSASLLHNEVGVKLLKYLRFECALPELDGLGLRVDRFDAPPAPTRLSLSRRSSTTAARASRSLCGATANRVASYSSSSHSHQISKQADACCSYP